MSKKYLELVDVYSRLRAACKKAGSQKKWCELNGVSPAYVSDVLNGRRYPGFSIYNKLGLVRVVRFVEKGSKEADAP